MIAMENQPGVYPVGVVEAWRQLMAKCVLHVKGKEEKSACGTGQLVGGVEAGSEGGIHVMRLL